MSTTPPPVVEKPKRSRRWIKITGRVLVVVFILWVGFIAFMWRIMHRTPEGFARVMMHLPWQVFLICPFETMWTHARAGSIHIGDPVPDFTLSNVDKSGTIQLSELNKTQPFVMIFGSYT